MSNKIVYDELIVFHPGYYVKELLEEEGMSQEELAKRLQTSGKNVSDLVNGRINLADDMALRLSIVFGTSVSMWLSLEKKYIEKRLEIEQRKNIKQEEKYIEMLDYSYWRKLGMVPETEHIVDRIRELKKVFRVASLDVLAKRDFMVQYRSDATQLKVANVICANAWVQTAINIAMQRSVAKYDRNKLWNEIGNIRRLTRMEHREGIIRLQEILSECGVALVLLPELENCGLKGAVKWIENNQKAVLALNESNKDEEDFWFSLFHEIGHVLQRKLTMLIVNEKIELLEEDRRLLPLEEKANEFAKEMLVPGKQFREFYISKNSFSAEEICIFAEQCGVSESLVLRRMQMEERICAYTEKILEYTKQVNDKNTLNFQNDSDIIPKDKSNDEE